MAPSRRSLVAAVAAAALAVAGLAAQVRIHTSLRRRAAAPGAFTLCVVGIFRNEAHVLREWVEHYAAQGVDEVLLLDNGSTDAWAEALDGAAVAGVPVTVLPAVGEHQQVRHYNELALPWLTAKGVDAAAVFDLDEFYFGVDGRTLRDHAIEAFAKRGVAQFSCVWSMFGSSGFVEQPEAGVRESFTWRQRGLAASVNVKSVVLVEQLRSLAIHTHDVVGATSGCPPGAQLNHYAIQSRAYFERVKMTRGDAARSDNVRDAAYFAAYDKEASEVEDVALRDFARKQKKTP